MKRLIALPLMTPFMFNAYAQEFKPVSCLVSSYRESRGSKLCLSLNRDPSRSPDYFTFQKMGSKSVSYYRVEGVRSVSGGNGSESFLVFLKETQLGTQRDLGLTQVVGMTITRRTGKNSVSMTSKSLGGVLFDAYSEINEAQVSEFIDMVDRVPEF